MIPNEGKIAALQAIIDNQLEGSTLHLFTDDITPDENTTGTDFTDPTFTGYSAEALTGWTTPAINDDGHAVSIAPVVVWTNEDAGSVDVFGYWIEGQAGEVLAAERFPSAPLTCDNLVPFPIDVSYLFNTE